MQTLNSIACSGHARNRLLALAIALAASTSLFAVELKFEQASDFRRNFSQNTDRDFLSVVREEGGLLRFSAGDKARLLRIAHTAREKPVDMVNEKVAAELRFKQPLQSFGIMARVQKDATECYVALVNIGPRGGMLRIFKGLPTDSFAQGAVASKSTTGLKPGVWYRLEVSATNVADGVEVRAKLMPAGGGEALMNVEFNDTTVALNKPGHIQLRFYSSEADGETDVRSVFIQPGKERSH